MSADVFKFKRGTTTQVNAYLPALGEPVYDTTLKQLKIGDGVAFGGVALANSLTADKLTTARAIALTGTVTGTVNFDGSTGVSMATSVGASLQASLDAKAPLASPTLTGTPTSPTAAPGTNTTQLATTAFVEAARVILAAADALKAPLDSPALTGTPTAPTPAVGTNTTQLATAAMVQAEIANKRAWTAYTPTVTATSNTFTTASATGSYMVAFGVCHYQVVITITTVGTGVKPRFTLPLPALAGNNAFGLAREGAINNKVGVAVPISTTVMQCVDYINGDLCTGDGSSIAINGSYPIA